MDSLIQIVTTAGAVALVFLVLCLFTRIQREPGNRGVFQRMPVLLPAFAFVIAVLVILQMGILPISVYKGANRTEYYSAHITENMSFIVYPTEIAYVDETRIELETTVGSEEYLLLQIDFIQNGVPVETLDLNLTDTSQQPNGEYVYTVNLTPGRYSIAVNGTVHIHGSTQEEMDYLILILYQAIQPSFQSEIVDWSTYQFLINILCFVFILGGLCIGREDKDRRSQERIDQEPTRGDDYIRPFH